MKPPTLLLFMVSAFSPSSSSRFLCNWTKSSYCHVQGKKVFSTQEWFYCYSRMRVWLLSLRKRASFTDRTDQLGHISEPSRVEASMLTAYVFRGLKTPAKLAAVIPHSRRNKTLKRLLPTSWQLSYTYQRVLKYNWKTFNLPENGDMHSLYFKTETVISGSTVTAKLKQELRIRHSCMWRMSMTCILQKKD